MKTVIAGSRTLCKDADSRMQDFISMDVALERAKAGGIDISEVVCGMAAGVDLAGKAWAEAFGIGVIECPADWDQYGKAAGHIRNKYMASIADAVIVIWDGESRGSKNMLENARKRKLPTLDHKVSWGDLRGYMVFDEGGLELGTFGDLYGTDDYGIEFSVPGITGKTIVPTSVLEDFFKNKVCGFKYVGTGDLE